MQLQSMLAAAGPVPTSSSARTSDLLYGHSLLFNNLAAIAIFAAATLLPLGAHVLDRKGSRPFRSRPHSWWCLTLLCISYGIWIPAIFSKDFSFNLGFIVPVVGSRLGLTFDEHHDWRPGPIHESTRSMVKVMWQPEVSSKRSCKQGAVLFAIYAFAVPLLKLALLAWAEAWRLSPGAACRRASRNCVLAMRLVSKWAAPDMFAYLLLYNLIRGLDRLPINALAIFDVGFTCYSVFSLTCALSSLAIPLPRVDDVAKGPRLPMIVRRIGLESMFFAVALLTAAWLVLFAVGLPQPCFHLSMNTELWRDHATPVMRGILTAVKLEDLVPTQQVSLISAMMGLASCFRQDKDLNLLLGFIMLLVFAIIFTVADMACLLLAAWQLRPGAPGVPAARPARLLRHLSMLDVFVMGVIVCTLAGSSYTSQGLTLEASPRGLALLAASEALHYLCYYLVMTTAHALAPAQFEEVEPPKL